MYPELLIKDKIKEFIEEDLYLGDVTPTISVPAKAKIVSRDTGIAAGLNVIRLAFDMFGIRSKGVEDGSKIRPGDILVELEGTSANILMVERTVLNILMRMSGIATLTREMVEIAKMENPFIKIAATRKTTPGFRLFEKIAVKIGGGETHRFSLGDCLMIKDNHIAVAGGLREAIRLALNSDFTKKIEVEVDNSYDLILAVKEGADIIMLDNMSPSEIKECVEDLKRLGLRDKVILEASGGIYPGNVREYAGTGVDIISSGYITHSSPSLNLSMKVI